MDVAKVVNHYYNLSYNDTGNITLVCPFHEDHDASLSINLDKGLLYCFGCNWKGDIIDFVAQHEKVNRLQAIKKIHQLGGNNGNNIIKQAIKKEVDKDLLRKAYKIYKMAESPDWANIPNYLVDKRGIEPEVLNTLGVKLDIYKQHSYLIPIRDNGRFAGYVRTREGQEPKYLYSKGLKRKQILWGSYKPGIVFVTEGVIDYIKAYQFGQRNIVCLMGWKASDIQVEKLKGVTDKIVCALDNDDKGKEGAEYLRKHFNMVEFPYSKGIKDIGEMSKKQFDESLERICLAI